MTVQGNALSDLDLHVYAVDIGGSLTVKGNTAQAFTSVLCNNVAGDVTVADNSNPGVEPGFGPPGAAFSEGQLITNCADLIASEIPVGNAAVQGNLTIRNNASGDGDNDFARILVLSATVCGNMSVKNNEVNAVELSDNSIDHYDRPARGEPALMGRFLDVTRHQPVTSSL